MSHSLVLPVPPVPPPGLYRRYYNSEEELHRIFKSLNGMIFPGGLTDLWMDSPYVVAARKLWQWAKEANDAGL